MTHPIVTAPNSRTRRTLMVGGGEAVRRWIAILILSVAGLGCRGGGVSAVRPPDDYTIRGNQLTIQSDVELDENHPLFQELTALGKDIQSELALPKQHQDVSVYLFAKEDRYREFLGHHYPLLPRRRAYFVGSSKELAIYTFWGDRVQEDLRHEYTHGVLHASLKEVPLWLDEGLAEYFEVPGPQPGSINSEYVHRLAAALYEGWRPNLLDLEQRTDFATLSYFDYQRCWAWVHFMRHTSPETQAILNGYLRDLRSGAPSKPLSSRLEEIIPNLNAVFVSYIRSLHADEIRQLELPTSGQAPGVVSVRRIPVPERSVAATHADPFRFEIDVPDGLPGVVLAEAERDPQPVASGRRTYEEFHRHGWNEVLELFVGGRLLKTREQQRIHLGRNPLRDGSDLQRAARADGVRDATLALQKLLTEQSAEQLRTRIQLYRAEQNGPGTR